ncbi:MAG: hypothetical protein ACRDWH_01445 [Acidimicrobiia bacterium]
MGVLDVIIAVLIGVVVWRLSMWMIRTIANPPPELDPTDLVEVDQDFRCSVCGAEITMRAANLAELVPPKHCREEMVPL